MLNPTEHLAVLGGIILSRQLSAKGQRFAPLSPGLNTAVFCRGSFTYAVLMQSKFYRSSAPYGTEDLLRWTQDLTLSVARRCIHRSYQVQRRLISPAPRGWLTTPEGEAERKATEPGEDARPAG